MRRHKAFARIILFLSIVIFTFAGIARTLTMHEVRVDLVTGVPDVSDVSEMGYTQSEELPESLGRPSTAGPLQSRDLIPAASFSDASHFDDLEDNKFFSKELNRKLKEYLILGSIAGLFTGVANGIQKQIMGTVSPNAYVISLLPLVLPPSCQHLNDLSQTVGRAVEHSNERSEDQEDPVSRSLSSMRDGDLQMLSVISRRMLNSVGQESGSQEG
jgi:hypothetical protein